jgi:hypothetical protein
VEHAKIRKQEEQKMKESLTLQIFHRKLAHPNKILSWLYQEKISLHQNNYDDGGDKNPPKGRLDKSHKIQVEIK